MKVINVGVIGAGRCGAFFSASCYGVFHLVLPHVDDKIRRCVPRVVQFVQLAALEHKTRKLLRCCALYARLVAGGSMVSCVP